MNDRIQVVTSDLHSGSQALNSSAGTIGGVQSQVSNIPAMAGNAYDGQLCQALERICGSEAQAGARLQNRALDLGEELTTRALGFEAANEVGRSAMITSSEQFTGLFEKNPLLRMLMYLYNLNKEKALSIWALSGLGLGGFLSLFSILIQPLNKGTPQIPSLSGNSGKPTTSFGNLIEKVNADKKLVEKKKNWWNSHGLNQLDQDVYQTTRTYTNPFNACGATTLAMLINFTNFTNGNSGPVAEPADLAKWAGDNGFFTDKLLSFRELGEMANQQGFVVEPAINPDGTSPITLAELQNQVQSGKPQIVLTKFGYDEQGNYGPDSNKSFDHFVIVTDISNTDVTIVNPHPSKFQTQNSDVKPTTINIEDFKKIWTYDDKQTIGQGFGITDI